MKLYNRIFSAFLAVVLAFGSFGMITVSAASDDPDQIILNTYTTKVYNTPQEKLKSMKKMLENDGYRFYVDATSGEFAVENLATGELLFSNPYDVSTSARTNAIKKQALSQIFVQYTDVEKDVSKQLYSFEEAAMRQQISVMSIKNGVRVEYIIGQEETRKLCPRWIPEDRFEALLLAPFTAAYESGEIDKKTFTWLNGGDASIYTFYSLDECDSKKSRESLLRNYPICEEMNIYTLASDANATEINRVETYIKAYTEYTFSDMEQDHNTTGYEETNEQYPVFKLALEYSLDKDGLSVRLPCNGLRYDMATYQLENLSILPYMGAGHNANAGYNFFPDGSGALFDFEQLKGSASTNIRYKVYGIDHAYHEIGSYTYQKAITVPVYGTVANETIYTYSYSYVDSKTSKNTTKTETVSESVKDLKAIYAELEKLNATLLSEIEENNYSRGYVAIIEEGDSLAELATYHAGTQSNYNTIINYFNPKPKDSYIVGGSVSGVSDATWTVVSDRKYTGNITLRYRMLSDASKGAAAKEAAAALGETFTYYDTTWLGMAEYYRDYLIRKGTLSKLTDEELEQNIPLYLEVFGALETQQSIATIPVDVMTPLTTFENIIEMYNALSDNGVKNVNFKMTGFANGGMFSTVPGSEKLKWEKNVGGKDGFKELVEKAGLINQDASENIGLYPDFDFAYVYMNKSFDSLRLKKDIVKTIDNRYASRQSYDATAQMYFSFYELAVSPSRYSKFYDKLVEHYSEYGLNSMSVASLGYTLNSDFDEDDPYNREDNKKFTVRAFEDLEKAGYSLMTENAYSYTWGYVDHILNLQLDSSRYIKASASVPFLGVVLHGYVQFAGSAFNEEGDADYALLRAIENGAGLYFILSYQNTHELKESSSLSQNYSIRFDIWKEDVISYYEELNNLLKDVQNKVIIDHQFLVGERILDLDELQADILEKLEQAEREEAAKQEAANTEKVYNVADAWKNAENAAAKLTAMIAEMEEINASDIVAAYDALLGQIGTDSYTELNLAVLRAVAEGKDPTSSVNALKKHIGSVRTVATNIVKAFETLKAMYAEAEQMVADAENAANIIRDADHLSEAVKNEMIADLGAYVQAAKDVLGLVYAEAYKNQAVVEDAVADTVNSLNYINADGTFFLDYNQTLIDLVKDAFFTKEELFEDGKLVDNDIQIGGSSEDDSNDRYVVNNNQIVLVTYGDRNDATHEKTAYKTFILNYNHYSVRVVYDGVEYTIPSGGYVVLYAD